MEEVRLGSLPAAQRGEAESVYLILSDGFCSWISVNEEHVCWRGPDPGLESCSVLKAPFLLDTGILRIVRLKEKTPWE